MACIHCGQGHDRSGTQQLLLWGWLARHKNSVGWYLVFESAGLFQQRPLLGSRKGLLWPFLPVPSHHTHSAPGRLCPSLCCFLFRVQDRCLVVQSYLCAHTNTLRFMELIYIVLGVGWAWI